MCLTLPVTVLVQVCARALWEGLCAPLGLGTLTLSHPITRAIPRRGRQGWCRAELRSWGPMAAVQPRELAKSAAVAFFQALDEDRDVGYGGQVAVCGGARWLTRRTGELQGFITPADVLGLVRRRAMDLRPDTIFEMFKEAHCQSASAERLTVQDVRQAAGFRKRRVLVTASPPRRLLPWLWCCSCAHTAARRRTKARMLWWEACTRRASSASCGRTGSSGCSSYGRSW